MTATPIQVGIRHVNNAKAVTSSTAYVESEVKDGQIVPNHSQKDLGVIQ
jgi:hypothetical protein